MKKPNVVFFMPDSYRGDVLGHQGNAAAVTPHLDAIVRDDAVSYTRAFAQNPVCTPSRCSFMTGWYPHVHGHRSMRNMLKEHEPNFMDVLRREGYFVWWGGKNDLFRVETKEDYLKHCDVKFTPTKEHATMPAHRNTPALPEDDSRHGAYYHGVFPRDESAEGVWDGDRGCVNGAVEFLKNRPTEQPFFLYLPLTNPHPAYRVEEAYYEQIDVSKIAARIPTPGKEANHPMVLESLRKEFEAENISEELWREVKRIYYAMCTKIDDLFGKIVTTLKEQGLYDDTIIVFFSDHGDFTGDYALPEKTHHTMQDCLVRVPLVIKPQKGVEVAPGNRAHLTELLDITATLYDLMDIDPRYTYQGKSLRASLSGAEDMLHDAVFAEVGGRQNEVGYVNSEVDSLPPKSFYGRQASAVRPFHYRGSHAVMCRTDDYKYVRRFYSGEHELYDLVNDPEEMQNLSGKQEFAPIENMMAIRLLDFFMETSDVMPQEGDSRAI